MQRLAVAFLLLAARASAQGVPQINAAAVDQVVRHELATGFSGVVLVAIDDSIVSRHAYGKVTSPDQVFWIASVTKSFTAAAILELQRAGRLSLQDSIARFIPKAPADKRAITIHQLLTHSAGFAGATGAGGIQDRDTAIDALLGAPLEYAPGKGYEYGNGDYELLAAIIEIVTHDSWRHFVDSALVKPRRLVHTSFQPAVTDWGHMGANGMSSTVSDLLRWTRIVHTAPELSLMEKPQRKVREEPPFDVWTGYAARLYMASDTVAEVVYSGSGDDGHTSFINELPHGVTVIVLSNAGSIDKKTWASRVGKDVGDFLRHFALAPQAVAPVPLRASPHTSHSAPMLVLIFVGNLLIFSLPAVGAGFIAWDLAAKSRDEWKLLAWVHVIPLAIWAPKIAFDVTRDPTSHNLWPFELVIWIPLSLLILGVFLVGRRLFGAPVHSWRQGPMS